MIVPLFHLSQTDKNLSVYLRISLADLANSELLVEDSVLYFSAPPYYVKIQLPGEVIETEDEIYLKLDNGELTITLTKVNVGETFPDLDLLSKLMVTTKPTEDKKCTMIQEIDSCNQTENENYDWFCPTLPCFDDEDSDVKIVPYPYGFGNSKLNLLNSKPELCIPINLQNPDHCSFTKRFALRQKAIKKMFNPEHYIADFCETDASSTALLQSAPWLQDNKPSFNDDYRHRLTVLATHRLPLLPSVVYDKDALGEHLNRSFVYLGLVDLLLAYTHDLFIREADENSESAWMIAKVASCLSFLEVFPNLESTLHSFYECALTFPLIRNWKLCFKVQQEVASLLKHEHAKSWCLYVLLQIRQLLIEYPGYYVFVDLYLDDYIVWLQKSANEQVLYDLGNHLATFNLNKVDLNLPLETLEKIALEILESEKLAIDLDHVFLK